MSVEWKPQAIRDLEAIEEYYLKPAPAYGDVFVDNVFAATWRLEDFPPSVRMVPEIDDPTIQEIFHQSYRIIYLFEGEGPVEILTIVHTSQQLGDLQQKL